MGSVALLEPVTSPLTRKGTGPRILRVFSHLNPMKVVGPGYLANQLTA